MIINHIYFIPLYQKHAFLDHISNEVHFMEVHEPLKEKKHVSRLEETCFARL